MDKRQLHHLWKRLRPISPWYFLGLSVICGAICVNALRQNNLTMIRLRDVVTVTDQQNGDVETALRDLREYVHAHMNTNLVSGPNAIKPPIQLKYRYERLVQAEKDRVSATTTQIYTEAQVTCERLYPASVSGGPRVPCIQEYVSNHAVAKEQPIPDSLYKFDFVSPSWSPDLAGWSGVASALFLGIFIIRYGLERWLRRSLHE